MKILLSYLIFLISLILLPSFLMGQELADSSLRKWEKLFHEGAYQQSFVQLDQLESEFQQGSDTLSALYLQGLQHALQVGFLKEAEKSLEKLERLQLDLSAKIMFLWLQYEWERLTGPKVGVTALAIEKHLPELSSEALKLSPEDQLYLAMIRSAWLRGRGSVQEELAYLQKTKGLAMKGNLPPYLLASYWSALGAAAIGLMSEDSVAAFHERAHKAYDGQLVSKHLARFNAVNKATYYYWTNGLYEEVLGKLAFWEEVLLEEKLEDHPFLPYIWRAQASALNRMGDVEKTISLGKRAILKMEKLFPNGHSEMDIFYNSLANFYGAAELENLGYQKKALEYYLIALEHRKTYYGNQNNGIVSMLANIGTTYFILGENKSGLDYTYKAINLGEKVLGKEHLTVARLYLGLGEYFMFEQQAEEFVKLTRKGLNIYKKKVSPRHPVRVTANVAMNIGYRMLGQEDSSIYYMSQAFKGYFPDFSIDRVEELAEDEYFRMYDHQTISNLFGTLADHCTETRQEELARKVFKTSLAWSNQYAIRTSYLEAGWGRSSVFSDHFAGLLNTNYELFQKTGDQQYIDEAFAYADLGKTNTLRYQLQSERAVKFGGVPEAELAKEDELFEAFVNVEKKLLQLDESEITLDLKENYEEKKQDYLEWEKGLEEKYPAYFDLKYDQSLLFPDRIREKLDMKNTLLIEFTWTNRGELFKTAFDAEKTILVRDSIKPGLEDSIKVFTNLLSEVDFAENQSFSRTFFHRYTSLAHQLYRDLLENVMDSFDKKGITKLLIIPDRTLGKLPFEVLLTQAADTSTIGYHELPYLIRSYNLRMEYAASLTMSTELRELKPGFNYLGMAPVFASVYRSTADSAESFSSLKYNQEEVMKAYKLLGGKVFRGTYALEKKVQKYMEGASILHFATHTLMNDSFPLYTSLVLEDDPNNEDDGFLHAYEIYPKKLNAQLAVLSACETGLGRWQNGEGMMSLARAFKYAGCSNIVMSLWQADDQASSRIIQGFFTKLKAGMKKDEALRQAKLDFLKEGDGKQFPHYWATFVLVGDDQAVDLIKGQSIPYLWYWLTGIVLVLGLAYFQLRKKKKA